MNIVRSLYKAADETKKTSKRLRILSLFPLLFEAIDLLFKGATLQRSFIQTK